MTSLKTRVPRYATAALAIAALLLFAPKAAKSLAVALVQDADQPARAPFVADVQLDWNTGKVTVPIPTGKRLVIDHVTVHASAFPAGQVQPCVLLYTTVAASTPASTYLNWSGFNGATEHWFILDQSRISSDQFYHAGTARIYADTLAIGIGFSGATPTQLTGECTISGHLVTP